MECDCKESCHYNKSEDRTGSSGQLYKMKLAFLLFVRGLCGTGGFHLASQMRIGGLFDDIVLRCEKTNDETGSKACTVWFIKVLHEKTSLLSLADLMSLQGNFSLPKYCEAFYSMEMASKEDEDLSFLGEPHDFEFVIYTNAVVVDELLRQWIPHSYRPDNFLNCTSNRGLIFSICEDAYIDIYQAFEDLLSCKIFLDELLPLLDTYDDDVVKEKIGDFVTSVKTKVIVNKLANLQISATKGELNVLMEEMKSVGNISKYKHFLPKVHFFTGQPCEDVLDNLIKKELEELLQISKFGTLSVFKELHDKLEVWWKVHNCYLTKSSAIWNDLLAKLPLAVDISHPHMSGMNKLKFSSYPVTELRNFLLKTKALNIISDGNDLTLSCIKVCQTVETMFPQKYIVISMRSLLLQKSDVLHRWPSLWCSILVIICDEPVYDISDDFCNELCEYLSVPDSRIVLITSEGNLFAHSLKHIMKDNYCEIQDKSKFIHLDDESQNELLEKDVVFQGNLVPLGALVNPFVELKEHLTSPIISELVKDSHLLVIGPSCCAPIDYYIPRSLECFIPINMSFLKSNTCDVIAITSITISELTHYILPQEEIDFFDSMTSVVNTECRFFILSLSRTSNVFNVLCSHFKSKNIHHFEFNGNMLMWKETKGDPSCLRDYILKDRMSADPLHVLEYMSKSLKSMHNPETVHDILDNIVVITGESGIGKSTLLTTLVSQTKSIDSTSWVLSLNLSSHKTFLSETKVEDIDKEKVLELLSVILNDGKHEVTNFEHALLRHSVQNRGNLIIVIDGVDEINPLYIDKALAIVAVLKETRVKKLWITSHPGIKCTLLKLLNAVGYELKPFTKEDQRRILMAVWSRKFPNTDQGTLCKFIDHFQETIHMDMDGEKNVHFGNSLQNMMITEVFQDSVKKFIVDKVVDLPEKITLIQLYNKFIEIKFQATTLKMNSSEKGYSLEVMQNNHMMCALSVVMDDTELAQFQMQEITKIMSDISCVTGNKKDLSPILQILQGVPKFIHHSFAEFFAGMWFSHNFHKCREFLTRRIFDADFAFVVHVFDWCLSREHNLHLAVLNQDISTVRNLLNLGADVNDLDNGGRTPLHLAVTHSKPFVSTKPDVNVTETDSYNAITKLLVEHAANVKMIDEVLFWRPIHYATTLKVWDALDLVLKDQVDMNELAHLKEKLDDKKFLQEGLLIACQKGYFNLMECFAACGVDLSSNIIETREGLFNPLHLAARYGQLKLVRCLLSKKVKLSSTDKKGNTPLHHAVREGMIEIVLYLVQRGADIDAQDKEGNTSLNQVVCKGNLNTVFFLVEQLGCNVNLENKYGDTPLHRAASNGHLTLVEYLLSRGASINAANKEGNTTLHRAVYMGNLPIVKTLLENGANVNLCNSIGDTPLSQSAGGGSLLIVQCLVESGADVGHSNEDGNTALHWASRQNNVKILAYLLDKGSDINVRNRYGNTALHRAVEHGNIEAANFLKEKGADLTVVNNAGYTFDTIRVRKVH